VFIDMSATVITPEHRLAGAGRFLSLTLGKELYALNALRVREIIRPHVISPVPKSPKHLLGVMNLRGKIVPVMDLRVKFELTFTGRTDRTCIVVVETGADLKLTGLMVDEVQEVLTLSASEIQEPPSFGAGIDISCVNGLAKCKEGLMILLDVDRLISEPQPASPL
jgi:purine-binding chemotaxis protein CheW